MSLLYVTAYYKEIQSNCQYHQILNISQISLPELWVCFRSKILMLSLNIGSVQVIWVLKLPSYRGLTMLSGQYSTTGLLLSVIPIIKPIPMILIRLINGCCHSHIVIITLFIIIIIVIIIIKPYLCTIQSAFAQYQTSWRF